MRSLKEAIFFVRIGSGVVAFAFAPPCPGPGDAGPGDEGGSPPRDLRNGIFEALPDRSCARSANDAFRPPVGVAPRAYGLGVPAERGLKLCPVLPSSVLTLEFHLGLAAMLDDEKERRGIRFPVGVAEVSREAGVGVYVDFPYPEERGAERLRRGFVPLFGVRRAVSYTHLTLPTICSV